MTISQEAILQAAATIVAGQVNGFLGQGNALSSLDTGKWLSETMTLVAEVVEEHQRTDALKGAI